MNLCIDCKHREPSYSLIDHVCARPRGPRAVCVDERHSKSPEDCGQLGKFFEEAE